MSQADRLRFAGRTVLLAIYVCVALVTPLLHHDLACHLQSKSHCDACAATSLASRVEVSHALTAAAIATIANDTVADVYATDADRDTPPGRGPPSRNL